MKLDEYHGTTREVTIEDLPDIAIGAGILGTGGGGDPRIGRLRLKTIFEDDTYPDSVEVIPPDEIEPDWTIGSCGGMGAPTISVEKLAQGEEEYRSLRAIENAASEEVDAVIPGEIGGSNSMVPLVVAALADVPVIDGDGMGRAFPELQMVTYFIYGLEANYAAITDERGNQAIFTDIDCPKRLEDIARAITVDMGGRSGDAFPLMPGDYVSKYAIPNTISLAKTIGERVHAARTGTPDPVDEVCAVTGGQELFTGKVTDVFRRNQAGFARGEATLTELDGDRNLTIEFQNEFLIARASDGEVLAIVPDLICIVDKDTAEPITTSQLRYGQRVRVIGIPAPKLLTTEEALDVVGPSAFGYDEAFIPLSEQNLDNR